MFLQDRIDRLARDIFQDVITASEEPEPLVSLCVLKGGYKFYSDLQVFLTSRDMSGCTVNHYHA